MKLYRQKILLIFIIGLSSIANAALPSNISDLVETSAPAVVNITSRKEVKMQNSFRGFDEFERFFGIPRGRAFPDQQQPQTREAVAYGSGAGSDGFDLTVTDEISKMDRTETVEDMISRMEIINYATYAKYRGKLNMGDSK